MRIIASFLLLITAIAAFGGCSSKQINETTDSIIGDVKDLGEKATEQH